MSRTRRDALRAFAGVGALGLAGCAGRGAGTATREDDPRTTQPSDPPTGTATDPSTDPSAGSGTAPDRLVLRRRDSPPDAPLTVFPTGLRDWLREAADAGVTVRGHEGVPVYAPEPILAGLPLVRLQTPDGDVDGTYEVDAEGGPRYELHVAADPVDSAPADATVAEASALPPERRALVLDAIDGTLPGVFPETELGEWVRREFFGGYVEHEGDTYVGRERQQTDAAFFSRTVWTVLSMTAAADAGADPVTLRLPPIDDGVRGAVDDALANWGKYDREAEVRLRAEHDPDAVAAFAAGTEALLTHTTAFSVTVE